MRPSDQIKKQKSAIFVRLLLASNLPGFLKPGRFEFTSSFNLIRQRLSDLIKTIHIIVRQSG